MKNIVDIADGVRVEHSDQIFPPSENILLNDSSCADDKDFNSVLGDDSITFVKKITTSTPRVVSQKSTISDDFKSVQSEIKKLNQSIQMLECEVTKILPTVSCLEEKLTFFNSNGKSTVDYMLTSNTLYHKIVYFNVDTPNELSDHCIISTGLNLEKSGLKHQKDLDEKCNHIGGNFLWSEDCKDKYVQALVEPKSATSIISLYTDLDDENNSDIDSLVKN